MIEVEHRIYLDERIYREEYAYTYGAMSERLVTFRYYNVKRDKTSHAIYRTYKEALSFARGRARDGRYKNYEFLIEC